MNPYAFAAAFPSVLGFLLLAGHQPRQASGLFVVSLLAVAYLHWTRPREDKRR